MVGGGAEVESSAVSNMESLVSTTMEGSGNAPLSETDSHPILTLSFCLSAPTIPERDKS